MIKDPFTRVLFGVIFIALGALAMGWWFNHMKLVAQESEKIAAFIDAGPRFTAKDGQKLCEVLHEVAKHSVGFRKSGLPLPECNYFKDK